MLRFPSIVLFAALVTASPVSANEDSRIEVMATLFPIIDFAQEIAGDRARIIPLMPPGAEAHSYAPTPGDMMRLSRARLFLYLSDSMETWIPGLVADSPDSLLIRTVAPESAAHFPDVHKHDEHEHDGECTHRPLGLDPHIWLDPLRAQAMADRIAEALSEADPANAAVYRRNCTALQSRIMELHVEIQEGLADCPTRILVCGGHFAFGHFAERYGLEHLSPYAGFSPNAQPSPRALAELVRDLRELKPAAIFYEEILAPKLAQVLAGEIGARLLPLHSLHNRTPADSAANETYFTLMRRNLEHIRQGLGCAP